jgi:hypothetical protein
MIRKQIYIRAEQDALLKRRAKALGVTESDVIRRAIEESDPGTRAGPRDPKAWEELLQYIRDHRSFEVPQTGRQWTRDELYEDS